MAAVPWRELAARAWARARGCCSRTRTIERRDHIAGWAHRAIFYGFLVLFAGTVILGFDTDFTVAGVRLAATSTATST